MARPNSFSEDEKINMRLRKEAGETYESIAEDYDCSVGTVQYHINPNYRKNPKPKKRKPSPHPGGRPLKFTPDHASDMERRWRQGQDLDSIALRYSTTRNTVRRYIARHKEQSCPPSSS